jgi:3-phosphoshikimate 1-carboxyvinyltransferase
VNVNVASVRTLRGLIRTPGDKSVSHRSILLGALSDGPSTITGCSQGLDVRGTLSIVQQLGAKVSLESDRLIVNGTEGLHHSASPLDCGNSGTTMRLLCGVLAGIVGEHALIGDPSLSQRPMDRVARPLGLMGVAITGHGERVTPPLVVTRRAPTPLAIEYNVPEPSAQVKSAVLFAGLFANDTTTVRETVRTRPTTEEMLTTAGISLTSVNEGDGRVVTVAPGRPRATEWVVPGDPSQAAFFIVLGAIHADAAIEVVDLYAAPERSGFVDVLVRMGATIERSFNAGTVTLSVRSSELVGVEVDASEIPSLDEIPVLAVAAAAATGTTRFRDAGELRVKESDRFEGTMALVRELGAAAHAEGDDLVVEGLGSAHRFAPLTLRGELDHRMVMAAAVAGAAGAGATLSGTETVATSYPGFFDDLASLR